jgi:hypothetical protein
LLELLAQVILVAVVEAVAMALLVLTVVLDFVFFPYQPLVTQELLLVHQS